MRIALNFKRVAWVSAVCGVGIAVGAATATFWPLREAPAPAAVVAETAPALVGSSTAFASSAGNVPVDANIFVNLAKKVVPGVVNVSTFSHGRPMQGRGGMGGGGGQQDLFRKFFEDFFRQYGRGGGGGPYGGGEGEEDDEEGLPVPPKGVPKGAPHPLSLGTGFIIDSAGLILTNNHVVADADEIKIAFTEDPNEKPTDGEIVGRDPELDVALIKVKTSRPLTQLGFGDSDALEVGEYVMAVGNPFGQGHTVTHGIISQKGRDIPELPMARYLQTDAPINPGNSGGPLVNLKGDVIGINNAIDPRGQGIGFAIPINSVKQILPQLRTKGTVARGYIGVLVNPMSADLAAKLGVPKDTEAPFVAHVYPGEPADKAGVKPYDVLLEFAGKAIRSPKDLITAVTAVTVGETVPVKVLRGGKALALQIQVAQRPQGGNESRKGEKDSGPGPKKKDKAKPKIDSGMSLENLTPEISRELGLPEKTKGVVVSNIAYGGAADRAGLGRGDVILEVDRKPVRDVDGFYALVKEKKSYLLRVRRGDPQGGEAFLVIILDLKE